MSIVCIFFFFFGGGGARDESLEKNVGKGENAGYQHFLLFLTFFSPFLLALIFGYTKMELFDKRITISQTTNFILVHIQSSQQPKYDTNVEICLAKKKMSEQCGKRKNDGYQALMPW